jgi:hypothetical protein
VPDNDTTALLDLVRQETRIPSAQSGFTDTSTLAKATAELHSYVLPTVKAERQEVWLSSEDTTYTVALTEGRAEYALPARAIGAGARKAVAVNATTGERRPLRWLEVEHVEETAASPSFPAGYTVRGNRLVLWPEPDSSAVGWELQVPFYVRPGKLVLTSDCARITAIVGTTLTTSTASATLQAYTTKDMVRSTSPFETVSLDASATFTNATTATVSAALAAQLQVGDYVCPPGASPFPQLPVELHPLLAQKVAMEQLKSAGDMAVAGASAEGLPERRKDAVTVVKPRVEGEARKVRNGMAKWRNSSGRW